MVSQIQTAVVLHWPLRQKKLRPLHLWPTRLQPWWPSTSPLATASGRGPVSAASRAPSMTTASPPRTTREDSQQNSIHCQSSIPPARCNTVQVSSTASNGSSHASCSRPPGGARRGDFNASSFRRKDVAARGVVISTRGMFAVRAPALGLWWSQRAMVFHNPPQLACWYSISRFSAASTEEKNTGNPPLISSRPESPPMPSQSVCPQLPIPP